MGVAMNAVFVLLACIAATNAYPALFPLGKTIVYDFHTDVRAGTIEPTPFISQFELDGRLVLRRDTSDPTLKNAFYAVLSKIRTGMHNGKVEDYEFEKKLRRIGDDVVVIEEPFLIIYTDEGRVKGVKFPPNEPGWSKNMKLAIASMFQLDTMQFKLDEETGDRTFTSSENNIHGNCVVSYDVHTEDPKYPESQLMVTKFYSPADCGMGRDFVVHEFNHVVKEQCDVEPEKPVNVGSRVFYEIGTRGYQLNKENIVIKKLVAIGTLNYFPWNARSEAHYLMSNTSFTLNGILPNQNWDLRPMNFLDVPITYAPYERPHKSYAVDAAIDVTQGRHVINREIIVAKLKKMLGEAADYLEENHLEMKQPDWKHGQTMNRILHTMSYMDVGLLEEVFTTYQDSKMPRDIRVQNIFLEMVPEVGTKAACVFILNVIRKKKISESMAVEMLQKLPMNVRSPTSELLTEMEELLEFNNATSKEVRTAGILCFSTLAYKTHKVSSKHLEMNAQFDRYVERFYKGITEEQDYEMKVVYMMAFRNGHIGSGTDPLAPIISGEVMISENPERIRLLAIWASETMITDYAEAYNLLWPIMANRTLPVNLRIAAYDILIKQSSTMTDMLRMYWFMVEETNEHLYNYHYTTIKGIANSVDPCMVNLRDNARKIIRFTRVHGNVPYPLSYAYSIDYKDEMYNRAEKIDTGLVLNEVTGLPEVFHLDHVITDGRKPVKTQSIHVFVEGCDDLLTLMTHGQFVSNENLENLKVLEVLRKAAKDMPKTKNLLIDIIVTDKGQVTKVIHLNEEMWETLKESLTFLALYEFAMQYAGLNDVTSVVTEDVSYDHLYEMHVVSDIGIPILLENRVPVVDSMKIRVKTGPHLFGIELESKVWRHGDYSMSIYNPISDVWHSIRRSTATDVSIPINVNIDFMAEAKNVKMSFPILESTNSTVAGFRTHATDYVTVSGDNVELLKASCPTCHHHEHVTIDEKISYENRIDLMDTGLQYSTAIFDCENGVTPHTFGEELLRAVKPEQKNDWNDIVVRTAMGTRQWMRNLITSPHIGNCGILTKFEPSTVHQTNRVDLRWRLSYEDVDNRNPTLHLYPSEKYNIRGSFDVIAAATNASTLTWDLNVNVNLNQGHLLNTANVHLTRKTPGEENVKICLDGQMKYSPLPTDPLKVGVTNDESNMKLTLSVGRTNEEKCMRDDLLISMTSKGVLSDESKKRYTVESTTSPCSKDKTNPLYANPMNIVPKTLNCLKEAIRYSTLRKYIVNLAHKKVPMSMMQILPEFDDVRHYDFMPAVSYSVESMDAGNVKYSVNYPMHKNYKRPLSSFGSSDTNVKEARFTGLSTAGEEFEWEFPMDNSRFSISALESYRDDELKMCSIYPKTVLTADHDNILFNLPEEWTLITGDHVHKTFAVFAKMDGPNMAVKIYAREYADLIEKDHDIEILPSPDNSVRVKIDGQDISSLEKGVRVPHDADDAVFKLTKNGEHIYVQLYDAPLLIVHGINHIALSMENKLQGRVSGLCGHLDGTYVEKIPHVYKMSTAPTA